MKRFEKIVLNIPHASSGCLEYARWRDGDLLRQQVKRHTDWFTNVLFSRDMPNVDAVVAGRSRFCVDCERLVDDPLEAEGQGIIYTRYGDNTREVSEAERRECMDYYNRHIGKLRGLITPETLLIDCHSFPSDEADVDICIGFNEDWSKPEFDNLLWISATFEAYGYAYAYNRPYSNSITPDTGFQYKSVMIEVNKRCYMDEDTLKFNEGYQKLYDVITLVYRRMLVLSNHK